jgi:hypothetical protein
VVKQHLDYTEIIAVEMFIVQIVEIIVARLSMDIGDIAKNVVKTCSNFER